MLSFRICCFKNFSSFRIFSSVCFYCLICFFILPFILHLNSSSFTSLVFIPNNTLLLVFYFYSFIQIIYFLSCYCYSKSHTTPFPGLNPFPHLPELYHCCCKLYFISHYAKCLSLTPTSYPLSNLT